MVQKPAPLLARIQILQSTVWYSPWKSDVAGNSDTIFTRMSTPEGKSEARPRFDFENLGVDSCYLVIHSRRLDSELAAQSLISGIIVITVISAWKNQFQSVKGGPRVLTNESPHRIGVNNSIKDF